MEDEYFTRSHSVKHSIQQFLNFLLFLLGITLFIIDLLLWSKIKNFNSFIFVGLLISFYIVFLTVYGAAKARLSPEGLVIYFFLAVILEIAFIVVTVYIYQDKAGLIDFMIKNMDDSWEAIFEATKFVGRNLDIIKILLITYICILVILCLINRQL